MILISHLHPDHVSDLPALLWLSNVARKDPLPLVGPDGNDSVPSVSTFLSRLFDGRQGGFPMLSATLGGSRSTVPLEVTVVNPSRQGHSPVFDRNGITVSAMAVPHANVPSIAYRVRTGQGTVVFGSDQSGENPHFAEFASNADVLVMHLTIGAGETLRGHASPALVGRVAAAAHARQLVLSHIGPFDLDRAVAEVRKHYGGPVVAGSDLQCIAVRK